LTTERILSQRGLLADILLPLIFLFYSLADAGARVVNVPCGQDIDATINADPKATATRFVLGACNYTASETVKTEQGDEIAGPAGSFIQRGSAFDPQPVATITGSANVTQVLKPQGTVRLEWLTVQGGNFTGNAGTGVGLAGGQMKPSSVVDAVVIKDNEGAGVSNFNGTFVRSELTNNTTDPDALGFIGSGLKAVNEVVVERSYIHDTQGNGIWCDEECNDTSLGTFVVEDTLVVNSGRAGIRWEKVGGTAAGEALMRRNEIHGNSYDVRRGGISIRDAENAIVQNNQFGAVTIAGVSYPRNAGGVAITATDSGGADRPNLFNIDIGNNILNGETVKGCDLPNTVVACAGDTPWWRDLCTFLDASIRTLRELIRNPGEGFVRCKGEGNGLQGCGIPALASILPVRASGRPTTLV
jgi:Right handed beta helix region